MDIFLVDIGIALILYLLGFSALAVPVVLLTKNRPEEVARRNITIYTGLVLISTLALAWWYV